MTMIVGSGSGGYEVGERSLYSKSGRVKSAELKMLSCQQCSKLLRDPVQLITCGCRYCKSCVKAIMAESKLSGTKFRCPSDEELFTKSDVRSDRGCQKEIDSLQIDCPTRPSPCQWRGPLKQVDEHQNKHCPNVEVSCKLGCGVRYLRSHLDWHVSNECVKRPVACQYCKASIPMEELQDHYASCPAHPIKCTYCNMDLPRRSELTKHLDETCNEYEMICPMKLTHECDFKGKRIDMTEHLNQTHSIVAFEKIAENSKEIDQLKTLHEKLADRNRYLEDENRKLRSENQQQTLVLQKFEQRLKQLENLFQDRHWPDVIEVDGGDQRTARSRHASPTGHLFSEDSGYSSNGEKSVSKLRDDLETQQSQLVRLNDNVQVMQETFTKFGITLDELRLRQDVLDVKTTNGFFIWKIPDIRRRYRDAVDRKTISLYSPPFFTSPHGYRMCIRVYLNGDGMGKGTHISLFFVLMKSEHDCLLSWPFKQSVRFTLINQVKQDNSISEAFAPDLLSPSFQQPTSEMNIASGFPKFVRQSILQNEEFTKGNTLYIKAQVDLAGLPLH